jgi:hypothetical protein
MRAALALPAAAMAALWTAAVCHYNDGLLPASVAALPDVGHRLLPDVSAHQAWLMNAPLMAAVTTLVLSGAWCAPGLFECLLVVMFVRPLFFGCTTLPEIKNRCNETFLQRLVNGGCNDNVFSGHVAIMLIVLAFLVRGGHVEAFLAAAIATAYSLAVVASRAHYTVDVLVAWLAAGLVLSRWGIQP